MDIIGKIIFVLPERSGTSARGDWKAGEFVLETLEQYPRKMVFSVWGEDRLRRFNIQQGLDYQVFFDIEAREYQGRWYNSIRAYDVRPYDPTTANPAVATAPADAPFPPPPAPAQAPAAPVAPASSSAAPAAPAATPAAGNADNPEDDLPF